MRLWVGGSAVLFVGVLAVAGCSDDDNTTSSGSNTAGSGGSSSMSSASGGGASVGGGGQGGAGGSGGGVTPVPTSYELGYSTLLGGLGWERAQGIYVASDGSIFVGGNTSSSNFPVTAGAFQTTKLGPADGNQSNSATGYVAKLDATGTTIEWATYLGGSRRDQVYAVRTDSLGNVYAVGATGSDDFPTTPGAYDETFNGPLQNNGLMDIFVTKFDQDGQILFSSYIGGATPGEENPRGSIHIDEMRGRIYVAGLTKATDFPTTAGTLQPNYGGGGEDGFVFALSLDGSTMEAATYIGGSALDMAFSEIEQHPDGSLIIGGWTTSTDFPVTNGAYQTSFGGVRDGWVARIGPDLDALVYATYLGGAAYDAVNHNQGVAIDSMGRAVVVGSTQSTDFPTTPGAFQTAHAGAADGFVAVLSEDGSSLVHSSLYGGTGADTPAGIFVAPSGQVAFTGLTDSDDMPVTPDAYQSNYAGGNGSSDIMVAVMAPDLSALVYATYMGSNGTQSAGERGRGTWITPSGSIWVSGVCDTGNFPTTPDAYQSTFGGNTADAIFMRFDPTFD